MNNEKDFIILMMILNILSNDVGEVLADEQGYIEQQTGTEKFYTVRTETYLDHILDGLSERDVKSFK